MGMWGCGDGQRGVQVQISPEAGERLSGLVIHTALEEQSASITRGQDGVSPVQRAPSLPSSSVCEHGWNELLTP